MLATWISINYSALSESGRVQVSDVMLLRAVKPLSNSPALSLFSASIRVQSLKAIKIVMTNTQHPHFFSIFIYNPLEFLSLKMTKHFFKYFSGYAGRYYFNKNYPTWRTSQCWAWNLSRVQFFSLVIFATSVEKWKGLCRIKHSSWWGWWRGLTWDTNNMMVHKIKYLYCTFCFSCCSALSMFCFAFLIYIY